MVRGDTTQQNISTARLLTAFVSTVYVVFLTCCGNFEVMSLDEWEDNGGANQPADNQPHTAIPDDIGNGGNPDSDCDGDSDTDSDTDSDGDTDTEPPLDTGPDWDTAEDGFGDVARVCSVVTFGGERIWIADAAAFWDGSIAVVGGFQGTALFGRGESGETELEATFGDTFVDGFLARFEPDGSLRWAVALGAVLGAESPVAAIDVTPDDGIVITGAFSGSALLGGAESDQPPLEATGSQDMYVAHYSGSGKLTWAATAGGSAVARGQGLSVLSDGSIAVAGHYSGTIVLGKGEPHETALPAHSGMQLLATRYAPNGQLVWATTADGEHVAPGIPYTGDGRTLVSAWSSEAIHASLFDADGELSWQVVGSGGSPRVVSTSLADGSFALSGSFASWLELPGNDGPIELDSPCPLDIDDACEPALFTALIDAHGSVAWAASSTASPGSSALAADMSELADGSVLVVGTLDGAVGFGDGEIEDTWLVSSFAAEPFAAIYGAAGALQSVARLGASWDDAESNGVIAHDDGSFTVTGTFEGPAQLIGTDDVAIDLDPIGQRDGYLIHVCP